MTIIMDVMADADILSELGDRIRAARLDRNLTVEACARSAGVSKTTWVNAEGGADTRLGTLIRILRTLGRVENLDALLPRSPVSPLDLLGRGRGRVRERATGRTATLSTGVHPPPAAAPVFPAGGVARIGVTETDADG